jgi:hypothetical protein
MCRSLGRFKSNVRNKTAPKGYVVEGYIATELVTLCSAYLSSALTVHNRQQRNVDECKGAGMQVNLDRITMIQIHWYIMFNSDDFYQQRM